MANWKKVIVSGSNANLNHITSSGVISASGKLFGGLQLGTHPEVVIYDVDTGELKYKELNLINTSPAPYLFATDFVSPNHNTHFKISHAVGNSNLVGSNIYPYTQLSASITANGVETVVESQSIDFAAGTINGEWTDVDVTQQTYYTPSSNQTSSFSDARDGLDLGQSSANVTRNFELQSYDGVDGGAVPAFDTTQANLNYGRNAFNDGGIGQLRFFVNDNVTPRRTVNLTNYNAISSTSNGVSVNLFATQSNLDSTTGDPDPNRHYRSGSWGVTSTHQRDGYNFAFALHTGSKDGTDFAYITNFCEWFYDAAGQQADLTAVVQSTLDAPIFDSSSANTTESISGIKFFKTAGATGTFIRSAASTTNYFKNVYPTTNGIRIDQVTTNTIDNIHHTQSGEYQLVDGDESGSITSPGSTNNISIHGLQDVAGANTSDLQVTASFDIQFPTNVFHQPSDFNTNYSGNIDYGVLSTEADIKYRFGFDHISGHKDTATVNGNQFSFDEYLVNTLESNANENQFEDFKRETYRIQSGAYTDTTVTESISTIAWDGEENIITSTATGHNSGSIVYHSHMIYPTASGDNAGGGTFTTTYGPGSQPDYTGATGEREYFRYFKLGSSVNGEKTVNIELVGTGSVVLETNSAHFTNGGLGCKIYAWKSSLNSSYSGTWKNVTDSGFRIGTALTNNSFVPFAQTAPDYSESANVDINGQSGINVPDGVVKFADNTADGAWAENDFLFVRIVVPENWAGTLDAMAVTFGTGATRVLGSGATYTSL